MPRISFTWKDDVFFDAAEGEGTLQNLPDGAIGQKAHFVANASLLWRSSNERIEVMGWVKNFMDQEYRLQSFDISDGFDLVFDVYGEPRTYGVTLSVYF